MAGLNVAKVSTEVVEANLKKPSISVLYKELENMNFKALSTKTDDDNTSSLAPYSAVLDKGYDMEVTSNALINEDWYKPNTVSSNYRNQYEAFQNATRILLLIGQFLSFFPLEGLHERDSSKLRSNYLSWRYFYCLSMCLLQGTGAMLCFYSLLKDLLLLFKIANRNKSLIHYVLRKSIHIFLVAANFSFFMSTFLTCVLFLRLAKKWPCLVKRLSNSGLDNYVDPKIKLKCYTVSTIFVIGVMVQHILAFITTFSTIVDCTVKGDTYEKYIQIVFFWVFETGIPYHAIFGVFLQVTFLMSVMMWTYFDVFIICISLYLSSILDQVNKKILKTEKQLLPPSAWRSIREDYFQATSLIHAFDDAINGIIFSSFINNIFFVCLQLFYLFENGIGIKRWIPKDKCPNFRSGPFNGYEHVVYFTYSLVFVLVRALGVFLIAAKVNTSSVTAGPALFAVPPAAYCEEVQRLIEHMYGDTVALSGMNFFYITKQAILTIAGSIVTYELVLMQIDAKDIIQY